MLHDLALARRLEAKHARDSEASARAYAAIEPGAEAVWEPIAGGTMIFCGVGSFMTHALGIGVDGSVSDEELDRLESFYFGRGSAVEVDLCPFAQPDLPGRLFDRGFRPDHFEQVLVREVEPEDAALEPEAALPIVPATGALEIPYCDLLCHAFDTPPTFHDALVQAGRIAFATVGIHVYAATADDRLAAAGAMKIDDGVVSLFGAATRPEHRRRGLQSALLSVRLRAAAREGCDLATVTSLVGSTSQRNIERAGFHPAYTRTVLVKPLP